MYALYERTPEGTRCRYRHLRGASLFGCRQGWIPHLLRKQLDSPAVDLPRWHVDVPAALAADGQSNGTLLIDLKPSSSQLSLYELLDVWGWSEHGWTPIMMRLRGLFVDADAHGIDRSNFTFDPADADEPIFSMTYLAGDISDGKLTGRWTPPGPSSTNGVLLWPPAFEYFMSQARAFMRNPPHGPIA